MHIESTSDNSSSQSIVRNGHNYNSINPIQIMRPQNVQNQKISTVFSAAEQYLTSLKDSMTAMQKRQLIQQEQIKKVQQVLQQVLQQIEKLRSQKVQLNDQVDQQNRQNDQYDNQIIRNQLNLDSSDNRQRFRPFSNPSNSIIGEGTDRNEGVVGQLEESPEREKGRGNRKNKHKIYQRQSSQYSSKEKKNKKKNKVEEFQQHKLKRIKKQKN